VHQTGSDEAAGPDHDAVSGHDHPAGEGRRGAGRAAFDHDIVGAAAAGGNSRIPLPNRCCRGGPFCYSPAPPVPVTGGLAASVRRLRGVETNSHEELEMIRNLILLAVVAGGLVAAGVIHIQQNGNSLQVTIDEQKLKATTQEVIREGEASLQKAAAARAATQTR
jgi:hypothetical protein